MIRTALLATGLALVASAAAMAQEPPASAHLSPQFMGCYHRAGDNTVQQDICAQHEVGAQDDRLNKAYQQVMRQMSADPADKASLRDDERSWIRERDYTCKVNHQTTNVACVVMKTAARADELEAKVRF